MAVDIGTLRINLVANTASFNGPLDKASQEARNKARSIQKDLNDIDLSEARGTIGLLGEDIGVHLPRHVQTFVAELPGVGAALEAAFPILAVVALGVALFEATEKVKKHNEESEKAKQEGIDLEETFMRQADALKISNLRLQDEIATLRGKPAVNGVVIAMEEGRSAAEKLTDQFQKALDKLTELLGKQEQGFLSKMILGDDGSSELVSAVTAELQKIHDLKNNFVLAQSKEEKDAAKKALDDELKNYSDTFLPAKQAALKQSIEKDKKLLVEGMVISDPNTGSTTNTALSEAEATKQATAAHKHEADILAQAILLRDNFNEALKETNKQTQANITLAQGKQHNDNTAIQEKSDAFQKQSAANANKIADANTEINLQLDKHKNTLQVIQGLMSQQDADAQELSAIDKDRDDKLARVNKQLEEQKTKVDALKAVAAKPESTAADKELFQKEFLAYQELELQKVEITRSAEGKIEAIEERRMANAQRQKEVLREMSAMNEQFEARSAILADGEIAADIRSNAEKRITLGLATERQAREQELKELRDQQVTQLQVIADKEKEAKDRLDAIAIKASKGPLSEQEMQEWKRALGVWESLETQRLEFKRRTNAEIKKLNDELANNEMAKFRKMFTDWKNLNQELGATFRQTIGNMNQSLAQFITTGQGNWRDFAAGAIESFIQIGLQYAESKAFMAILDAMGLGEKKTKNVTEAQSSVATAQANALADIPFPANLGAAATVGAVGEGFVAEAAALHGGILPNRDMLVHTHPEEMILPRNISNFIIQAAGGSTHGNGGTTHQHMIFAPQVHAVDAQGVDRVLTKHMDVFTKKMTQEMRRRNVKV